MTANLAVMPARHSPSDPKLAFAFPKLDPGILPAGSRVLVQFQRPRVMSAGGIILPADVREAEQFNIQTALMVAHGPLAFRHRDTGELWHEGAWAPVGTFVRIAKHGGDRWAVPVPDGDQGDEVIFGLFDDHNVVGIVVGDPLKIKAYV